MGLPSVLHCTVRTWQQVEDRECTALPAGKGTTLPSSRKTLAQHTWRESDQLQREARAGAQRPALHVGHRKQGPGVEKEGGGTLFSTVGMGERVQELEGNLGCWRDDTWGK